MRTIGFLLLGFLLLVLGLWLFSGPQTSKDRYFADAAGCRARVGIPDTTDPTFADRYQTHRRAWEQCMRESGHAEALRRGIIP